MSDWSNTATESVALTLFNDQQLLKKTKVFIRSTMNTKKKQNNLARFVDENIEIDDWAEGVPNYHELVDELIVYHYPDTDAVQDEELSMWLAYKIHTLGLPIGNPEKMKEVLKANFPYVDFDKVRWPIVTNRVKYLSMPFAKVSEPKLPKCLQTKADTAIPTVAVWALHTMLEHK